MPNFGCGPSGDIYLSRTHVQEVHVKQSVCMSVVIIGMKIATLDDLGT